MTGKQSKTSYYRQGKSPHIKAVQGSLNRKEGVPRAVKRERSSSMLGGHKTHQAISNEMYAEDLV